MTTLSMSLEALTEEQLIKHAISIIQEPEVFLVFSTFGSTGHYFFYTLLDDHPEIYNFPFELHRAPVDVDNFDPLKQKEYIHQLLVNNDRLFDTSADRDPNNSLNKLGPKRDQSIRADKSRFVFYLRALSENVPFNFRHFCLAVVLSYNFARGIFKRTHKFAIDAHDFAGAFIIREKLGLGCYLGVCRHPLNVYVSACNRRYNACMDDRRPEYDCFAPYLPTRYLRSGAHTLQEFYQMFGSVKDAIALVPIEEAHANPEKTMRRVASHMGLTFSETLLKSTMGGMEWGGSHYTRIHGFDRNLHRYVTASKTGWGDALAVLYCTMRYQQLIGYTERSELTCLERIRMRLWGLRYYKERWKFFVFRLHRSGAIKSWIIESLRYLRDILSYSGSRFTSERVSIGRVAQMDRVLSTSIEVIVPIQPGSMEIQKGL